MKKGDATHDAAPAESPPETTLTRQMGVSHAEFFRILPPLLEEVPYRIEDRVVRVTHGGRCVLMALGPEVERRLGAMRIPGFELRLTFSGYRKADVEAFMARFTTVFHRGGG